MNLGKICIMGACLTITVVAVVTLRQELGSAPSAVIPGDAGELPPPRVSHQPTILLPQPAQVGEMSPIYHEQSPAAASWETSEPEPLPVSEPVPQPLNEDRLRDAVTTPSTFPAQTAAYPSTGVHPLAPAVNNGAEPTAPLSKTYTTIENDSLWSIAVQSYGNGEYYKALWLYHRQAIRRPDHLAAGLELEIPSAEKLRQLYPRNCPPAELSVADESGVGTELRTQRR